jgi:hypothetical protein
MSSVDEMLRVRLRVLADVPVGSAEEVEKDVLGRLARRRRRRRALSGGAVLAVALLGGALVTAQASDDEPDVAVGNAGVGERGPSTADSAPVNSLVSIAVEREVEGGENVVFTFEALCRQTHPGRSPASSRSTQRVAASSTRRNASRT